MHESKSRQVTNHRVPGIQTCRSTINEMVDIQHMVLLQQDDKIIFRQKIAFHPGNSSLADPQSITG